MRVLAFLLALIPAFAFAQWAPTAYQEITLSTSEATSSELSASTRVVRVACTVACTLAVSGASTTSATSAPIWLPANTVEHIKTGLRVKTIIAIAGGAGTLHLTEVSQ